jgi:hypothetical protein
MADDNDLERSILNARDLIERMERENQSAKRETKMVLLIGMLVVALGASLTIAMMLQKPKEKELERHRCEMDKQVQLVWDYKKQLESQPNSGGAIEVQKKVDAKRDEFQAAAKAACAK